VIFFRKNSYYSGCFKNLWNFGDFCWVNPHFKKQYTNDFLLSFSYPADAVNSAAD